MKKISSVNIYATPIGSQNGWELFMSDHATMRCDERALDSSEIALNLAIFMDLISEFDLLDDIVDYSNSSDKKAVKSIGWRMQKRVQFRDDINDTNFALAFFPAEKEVHVVTCWSQTPSREYGIENHTKIKKNHFVVIFSEKGLVAGRTDTDFYGMELSKAVEVSDIDNYKI